MTIILVILVHTSSGKGLNSPIIRITIVEYLTILTEIRQRFEETQHLRTSYCVCERWRCQCLKDADVKPGGISRRDFIKVTTGIIGGIIGVAIGLPAIAYVLDPAFKPGAKEGWIPVGKQPTCKSANRIHSPSRASRSMDGNAPPPAHGGFVIRKSENPQDIIILNSRCTHLGCTVNWKEEAQAFVCPCHDAKFSEQGAVLGGPPAASAGPLTRSSACDDDGVLEIFYKES